MTRKRARKEGPEAQKVRLRATAPDLANLVDEGRLTLNGAMAALDERERQRRAEQYLLNAPDRVEQELRRALTPAQWREHEAWIKRRDEFDALSRSEQVDIARWVLAVDPDLAEQVKNGLVLLSEAYHELKQAEAFLGQLAVTGQRNG